VVEAADKVGKYASLLISGAKRLPLPPLGPKTGQTLFFRRNLFFKVYDVALGK
jgi:hypothetical protein